MTIGLKLKERKNIARTLQLALFFFLNHTIGLFEGFALKNKHGITNN